jgi:hypothetical protein
MIIVSYSTNFILSYAITPALDDSINSFNKLKITLKSTPEFHGIAGQYMKIEGEITNPTPKTIVGGIAYISIVDTNDKIPVDLEDWSVEKGLYIPSFQPFQNLPLEWNIRLVKAGYYAVDILFNIEGQFSSPPLASSKIQLEVLPKFNLNPGNVLPIAFGVPGILIGIFGILNYIRGRKTGIYD